MSLEQTVEQRPHRVAPSTPAAEEQESFFVSHAPQGSATTTTPTSGARSRLRALRDLVWPPACSHHD